MKQIHRPTVLAGLWLASFAACPAVDAQCRTDRVEAADAQNFSHFGKSVAISGNRMVIGETDFEQGGKTTGAAYVYELSASGWTQQARLLASDGRNFDDFGVAVAIDGDTILVGADSTDGPLSGAVGAVYSYSWNGSDWVETQRFKPSDGASGGFFGAAVAIDGDTAVIGRFWDSARAHDAGSAYVFMRSNGTWAQTQKLVAPNPQPEDNMGMAVAISGDTIVVGAPNRFSAGNDDTQLGRVLVFERANGVWTQLPQAVLRPSNPAVFDQFGIAVAADGDRIAVGAWQDTFFAPTSGPGAAYVFERIGGTWQETQDFTAPDPMVQAEFGGSIAIQGSWLLIGAPSRSAFPLLGAVYSYHESDTGWSLTKLFLPDPSPSDNWKGNSLALDGNHAVAGAFIESLAEEQNGTAYVLGGFDPFTDEGFGLAGSGGTPQLAGSGTACAGSSVNLVLSGARPNSTATLYLGPARIDRPFHGGTLVPAPRIVRHDLHTNADGQLVVPNIPIPPTAAPTTTLYAQIWIVDPQGPEGLAASNAIAVSVP